ncbi:MAG: deoxyribonuclease IV [candidate division WOR-3 bacterium]|nr:MAG: deoxyribonuclease IV [candidate division WOR-3 bacterium]
MKLGFHISIAGGFKNVLQRAEARGCETVQLFSRNPRGWKYSPLDPEDIALFKEGVKSKRISPVFVHMPYLPNLASSTTQLFKRSVDSLIEDLKRSEVIGAPFLIMHIGSSEDNVKGMKQMMYGINRAFAQVRNNVVLLLENTAGSGHELGSEFEQLHEIMSGVDEKKRIGIVFDTAHAFEAGYDLRTKDRVAKTIERFDNVIGLRKLYAIHLNDSKTKLGSRSDRHWHIAQGEIGRGMRYILTHPALQELPFIMETPRTNLKEDLMNMRAVKKLLARR